MDVAIYLRLARKWWWLFIAAFLVGGGLAYGISLRLTPSYQATTTLLVVQRQAEGAVQLNDIQTAERLANTFSRLVTIRPVMEQAISDGRLPLRRKSSRSASPCATPSRHSSSRSPRCPATPRWPP